LKRNRATLGEWFSGLADFAIVPFALRAFIRNRPFVHRRHCQRQRRREYHRRKVAADSVYRQVCNDSSRKWRAANPGYWKRYREAHLDATARNRTLQQTRDQARRVRDLANNNLALDLKSCAAAVWLFGPTAENLANNNLATTQVFIVEGLNSRSRNLANNNALASAPVLTDNRISPPPC
jgi:hypothetical protein